MTQETLVIENELTLLVNDENVLFLEYEIKDPRQYFIEIKTELYNMYIKSISAYLKYKFPNAEIDGHYYSFMIINNKIVGIDRLMIKHENNTKEVIFFDVSDKIRN
jgi:hypothetical protein